MSLEVDKEKFDEAKKRIDEHLIGKETKLYAKIYMGNGVFESLEGQNGIFYSGGSLYTGPNGMVVTRATPDNLQRAYHQKGLDITLDNAVKEATVMLNKTRRYIELNF